MKETKITGLQTIGLAHRHPARRPDDPGPARAESISGPFNY